MKPINATAAAMAALASGTAAHAAQDAPATYRAQFSPLNVEAADGYVRGDATLEVTGDMVTVAIDANGVPAGMMHMQHIHGHAVGDETSRCPGASADENGDGLIDLTETAWSAGATMIPLHDAPASMAIGRDTYPAAGPESSYTYKQQVSMEALQEGFASKFPEQDLALDRRVIIIHGVPEGTDLPDSVGTLADVRARMTLPIACAEIRQVES